MYKPKLVIFDLDGTLITSYMENIDQDFNTWHVLPGRREKLAELRQQGTRLAIATNQAGVAFGHVSEGDVIAKISQALEALGRPASYAIYDREGQPHDPSVVLLGRREGEHILDDEESTWLFARRMPAIYRFTTDRPPIQGMTVHVCYAHAKSQNLLYKTQPELARRKPGPDMLFEAIDAHGLALPDALFVGDMDSDREAAYRAEIEYQDADDFFGS